MNAIDRRTFIKTATLGVAGLSLGLSSLRPIDAAAAGNAGIAIAGRGEGAEGAATQEGRVAALDRAAYGDWRDVYRERWAWDKVLRSSHWVNCWYQAHCCWNVYMKDGLVWREEQAADYPQVRPEVPDFNPRGCQKGACFSERMYDPARVRYPLKRVGERGSGRWKRVSWDEACDAISDSMIDAIVNEGSDRVVWDLGPGISLGTQIGGQARLRVLLDSTSLDMNTEIGDGHRGTAETFGKIVFERSADDYFFSDLIVCWGANPMYTQIPNMHFLTEARYNGASIVCIAPDYSATALRSDLWVPVKPGGDAALALGVAGIIIEEGWMDVEFVREQTDLPFLVRDDTQRFLRESDLKGGGDEDQLYVYDAKRGLVAASRRKLEFKGIEPLLEGSFEIKLRGGRKVVVRTVLSKLKEQLAAYTPEKASEISGTPEPVIRDFARRMAQARAASMVTTSNFSKYYHGNLVERAQALVFALTGNYGKKGSGFVGFPFLMHDGLDEFVLSMFNLPTRMLLGASQFIDESRLKLSGYTDEMIVYERSRHAFETGGEVCGALFWYVHGGLLEASDKLQDWDPYLKRPIREVLDESVAKGWQYIWPRPGNPPRVLFSLVSNPLRRIRAYTRLLDKLWPELTAMVTIDWRMTSTGLWSDYVLPASAWYERVEHKWVTPLMPFLHAGEKATDYHEALSDWEIMGRLARSVDRRAAARGVKEFEDRAGRKRSFVGLFDRFTSDGKFGLKDDDKVAAALLENSSTFKDVDWEEIKKKGWKRFDSIGTAIASIGAASEIKPDDTFTPLTQHVFDKKPYPTLSRRMQFYIDQELYLEMGETLPVHKEPPNSGGDYPLRLTGGHTRWSIHSAWRDDKLMLQQQRGEPIAWMNPGDAAARGLEDGSRARVYNDLDSFEIQVKVTNGVRPGQFIIYHAWDNFQFKDHKGFQNLIASPLNPVELAGGQYHLRPMSICLQPSHTDRDTKVEVERV